MSVKMSLDYQGNLRCALAHEPSGTRIGTDAPTDNMGQGALFSPTDLVGAALAACAVTTMAIKAQKEGIAFSQATATVLKEMTASAPRKIAALTLDVSLSQALSLSERARVEEFGNTCPVALSLHGDVRVLLRYHYV